METQHRFASQGPLDCSVLTTWTLLFRRLEERSGHAAKLLILWGFLDNRDIWYDLFKSASTLEVALELPRWYTECVDEYSNFDECTQLLVLYSFIDVKMGSSSFSMHPVLHQWCFQASEDNMAGMAWLAFVLVASSAPKDTIMDHKLIQKRLLPHCDRLSFLLRETIPKAPYYEEESLLDIACDTLGSLYRKQGKLKEAEDILVRALAGQEKALEPEHTSTLNTVHSLGLLYVDQGKLTEAEDMYMRALAGYEKALGPEHTSILQTVNNLGILYRDQGKLTKAEDEYAWALAGYEKVLEPEHTSTLSTVNNLGIQYRDQGKLTEAEDMYVRALAGYEKTLGPEHNKTVTVRRNIAMLKNPPKSKTRRIISRILKKIRPDNPIDSSSDLCSGRVGEAKYKRRDANSNKRR